MHLIEISEEEYKKFRENYRYKNFWQSAEMNHFRNSKQPAWNYVYLGYKNDNDELELVTALNYIQTFGKYYTYMCMRGFMTEKEDISFIDSFLKELKSYLDSHNCLSCVIDPYIEYQKRDKEGNPYGDKRDDLINIFEKNGFKHQGFGAQSSDLYEPRFMSVLPLKDKTIEELSKELNIQTRQNINNTEKEGIKIRELAINEMGILEKMVSTTGDKRDFYSPSVEYYEKFKECFGDNMHAYYAYLDTNDYINRYQDVIDNETKKIEELGDGELSKKNLSRKKQSEQLIASAEKRVKEGKELLEKVGEEVPLAAAMFVYTDYEVVYLFSGSDDQYKHFKAPYAIQWKIIKDAKERNAERYNFYGISGNFTEDSEGYGVYLFKKGFNADVIELLGNFLYIAKPKTYSALQGLRKLKHIIKK